MLIGLLSQGRALAQQLPGRTGQVTEMSVVPQTDATYKWSVFCDPAADFTGTPISSGPEYWFLNSIDDRPRVKIFWNLPGTYFVKVLVRAQDGCTNFKVGIIEVMNPEVQARIFPNPVNGNDLNFSISLQESSLVTIDLYSSNHELISRIFEGPVSAGKTKTIVWRCYLPQGLYYYQIVSKDQVTCGQIISIRVY